MLQIYFISKKNDILNRRQEIQGIRLIDELVSLIRAPHPTQVDSQGEQAASRPYGISHRQISVCGDESGGEHPDSHAAIERRKVSGGGGPAHLMGSDIHEQALESGHADAETDPDQQRASEEGERRMHGSEHAERERQGD